MTFGLLWHGVPVAAAILEDCCMAFANMQVSELWPLGLFFYEPSSKMAAMTIWALLSVKVSLNMHKMHRFRLSCACKKYHASLCSPFLHSV